MKRYIVWKLYELWKRENIRKTPEQEPDDRQFQKRTLKLGDGKLDLSLLAKGDSSTGPSKSEGQRNADWYIPTVRELPQNFFSRSHDNHPLALMHLQLPK